MHDPILHSLHMEWQNAVQELASAVRHARQCGLARTEIADCTRHYAARVDLAFARLKQAEQKAANLPYCPLAADLL